MPKRPEEKLSMVKATVVHSAQEEVSFLLDKSFKRFLASLVLKAGSSRPAGEDAPGEGNGKSLRPHGMQVPDRLQSMDRKESDTTWH